MQGEKMVGTQVARVLLHSVTVTLPKPDFGDPALEKFARLGLALNRNDERTMQLISVRLVADSLRRLMPSREAEINAAEESACSDAKRRDGTHAIVWPKAEFLALLPTNLSVIAGKKFMDDDIVKASRDIFVELKRAAKAEAAQASAAHAAQPQQPAQAAA